MNNVYVIELIVDSNMNEIQQQSIYASINSWKSSRFEHVHRMTRLTEVVGLKRIILLLACSSILY